MKRLRFGFRAAILVWFMAIESVSAFQLYFTESPLGRIRRMQPDGSGLVTLSEQSNSLAQGLAVDLSHDAIYWVDFNRDKIRRAPLGGGPPTNVMNAAYPADIAIDHVHGKMYYSVETDVPESKIHRANLDGSNEETLATAFPFADGLAIDEVGEKIYWVTYDSMQRSNLDGSQVETLGTRVHDGNAGVAIDRIRNKVYFSDRDRIYTMNLDGSGRVTYVLPGLSINRIAIDPVGQHLFWTIGSTSPNGIVQRANLDGSDAVTIASGLTYPYGIVYVPEPPLAPALGVALLALCLHSRR